MYICTGLIHLLGKGIVSISWRESNKEEAWETKGHRGFNVLFEGERHPQADNFYFRVKTLCDGRRVLSVWEPNQHSLEYEIYGLKVVIDPEYLIDNLYRDYGVLSDLKRSTRHQLL